ncbi:MAG: hypothetical protein OEX02_01455 [Cyclobacteriaceae bacterium]|nr:hypothetical protein [Cyclobacteriaceae bacterium]
MSNNKINVSIEDINSLIEEGVAFWLKDQEHIRTPFPAYIHDDLKKNIEEVFLSWYENLEENYKNELTEEFLAERFEGYLFEVAMGLVKGADEKITILYPFLPRIGDLIREKEEDAESNITDRKIVRKKDEGFLEVTCLNTVTKKEWKTQFQLPV